MSRSIGRALKTALITLVVPVLLLAGFYFSRQISDPPLPASVNESK